jgi:hypothetical protein
MTPLFKKLNYKEHTSIVVINSPKGFEVELSAMAEHATVITNLKKVSTTNFAMCFVSTQAAIDNFIDAIYEKLEGDAIIWLCYPKMSSKNYTCDFNRDTGWASLGKYELEPVRQVAIDADYSALRFRKVAFIKTITRRESYALTTDAKKRTTQKGK